MLIEINPLFIAAGFFEPENSGAKKAFIWTIQKLNLQGNNDIVIVSSPVEVAKDDSFQVSKRGRLSATLSTQCWFLCAPSLLPSVF